MHFIPLTDYMFLAVEQAHQPMSIGALQLFIPPVDAGIDFAHRLRDSWVGTPEVGALFRRRPGGTSTVSPGRFVWVDDEEIDLDYHVRLCGLPRPGRIRDLHDAISLWHSTPLDRNRPLWELYIIDGLEDGRVAVYLKIHHSLLDGMTAMKILTKALTEDESARNMPALFARRERGAQSRSAGPSELIRGGLGVAGDLLTLVPRAAKIMMQLINEPERLRPLTAPRTMFNVPIGGARRFAAQSWPLDRIQTVAAGLNCTVNDIVLAMCSGALRDYLLRADALPDRSLLAFVPISVRSASDNGKDGNVVGGGLAALGTDHADPRARVETIRSSMTQAKGNLAELNPTQAMALTGTVLGPIAATAVMEGLPKLLPPTANVVISNIPGPREDLFLNGARLDGFYPVSAIMGGGSLNITVTSTNAGLAFGIIGCRDSVPRLQGLLACLESSLCELEQTIATEPVVVE